MAIKPKINLCLQCPALCCHYITIEIDKPVTRRDYDDIRWQILHKDVSLLIEEDRWLLQCQTVCEYLLVNNSCGIYERRPLTCRKYSTKNCDYHTTFEGWETEYLEIKTLEEFETYLKEEKKKQRKETAAQKTSKKKSENKLK